MTARVRLVRSATLALAGTVLIAGCAASERQRPIQTSRVATSGNTLEAARKQLEGRWTLVSLEYAAPDGKRATVEGTAGTLTADGFGNLAIEYRLSEGGCEAIGTLGFNDPQPGHLHQGPLGHQRRPAEHRLRRRQVSAVRSPSWRPARQNPFALERTRYYEFRPTGC